jgi:uncharacterized membrane protein
VRRARTVDLVMLATVVLSASLWLTETRSPIRTITTVLALCVAPGWGLLRAAGGRGSAFQLVQAIALSCCLVMLTGLLLVTRLGWDWQAGVNALNMCAAITLTASLLRPVPVGSRLRDWPRG